jgi:uncharacterized membrane protein (UPF0182 family)
MRLSLRWVVLILVLVILFVIPFFETAVRLLTDWQWYQELGYPIVFQREVETSVTLGVGFALAFFLIVYLNVWLARHHAAGEVDLDNPIWRNFPYYEVLKTLLTRFLFALLVLLAIFMGVWGASEWQGYLSFSNATGFSIADPLFQRDIGFYVFRLPFFQFLQSFALATLVIAFIVSALIHLVQGELSVLRRGLLMEHRMRAHLLSLIAVISLLFAVSYQFDAWGLLFSARGVVYGASYTDVHADLPLIRFLTGASVLTALLALFQIVRRGYKLLLAGVGLIVLGLVGQALYPELVQKFEVVPNEINKERPYIQNVIQYTRQAYDLQNVDEREFPAEDTLSANDLKKNELTIKNIRLWEHQPLLATFAQLQEIRTYYDFVDVDNDRYTVNGEYRQVLLSPRELASENLPSRNWINEHLTYTHGYGLCLGPVNVVTSEGQPEFFIKDIPPVANTNISVKRPEIYYGELSGSYCFVNTTSPEFDYPSGEENKYTKYVGTGGIRMDGIMKKILFALRFKEIKFLLANDITRDSRLMFYRRVVERVEKLIPMARVDRNPYMVINEGRLYWIIDAYTTTSQYPYSEPRPEVGNYIRNSIKAVVDAYNGDVKLYVSTPDDPLIQTQMKIFPGVFQPLNQMPPSLQAHIRVPEYIFSVQASLYATYHMTDPQVFFNKEDLWKIPRRVVGGQDQPMDPYYTIMKLALPKAAMQAQRGRGEEEFILMVPFTPSKKDNMIAWMAARCDAPNYGKLVVYNFPKQKLVYGPQQIEVRIDQETEISKQLTLWNQGGSTVIRGSLLVIPIEKSVLYIQPLYLSAAQGGKIPELKRVIVAYGNTIAMEENLELALGRIFGGAAKTEAATAAAAVPTSTAPALPSFNLEATIKDASDAYEHAQQALRNGDWTAYGQELKKLESALRRLREKK